MSGLAFPDFDVNVILLIVLGRLYRQPGSWLTAPGIAIASPLYSWRLSADYRQSALLNLRTSNRRDFFFGLMSGFDDN